MNIQLWEDSEIVQDNSQHNKGRVYVYKGNEFPSVTNLLGKIQPKDFLKTWTKRVGEEKAEQIRVDASTHGSAVHCAIEAWLRCDRNLTEAVQWWIKNVEGDWLNNNLEVLRCPNVATLAYQKLIKPFSRFLDLIEPVGIEKPLCWSSECGSVGFGGTSDAFLKVNGERLLTSRGVRLAKSTLVVCDWKNFRKPKEPIAHTWSGDAYYPLIGYCMQLSAYCAAFNQLTDKQHRLNQALLVCAHPKADYADIYYLDSKAICWYWKKFNEAIWSLKTDEPFDWIEFCALSEEQGFLGEKLEIVPALTAERKDDQIVA